MFDRLESVTQSITVFRKNENGELYPVEISKEKAWYYAPSSNDFSHLANEYLKSASSLIQLNKENGESFGAVPAYLALHGLELTLKGALHSLDPNTYSIKELRKRNYGHNIANLLNEYHKHLDPLLDQFDTSRQQEKSKLFSMTTHPKVMNI